jgi:hypothetical protein
MPILSANGNLLKAINVDFGAIGQELRGHDASIGCEFAYFRFWLYYTANEKLPADKTKLKRIGGLSRLPAELGNPDEILDEFLQLESLIPVPALVDQETGEEFDACYRQELWQSFIDAAKDSYDRKLKNTEPGRMAAAAKRKAREAALSGQRLASRADSQQESTSIQTPDCVQTVGLISKQSNKEGSEEAKTETNEQANTNEQTDVLKKETGNGGLPISSSRGSGSLNGGVSIPDSSGTGLRNSVSSAQRAEIGEGRKPIYPPLSKLQPLAN